MIFSLHDSIWQKPEGKVNLKDHEVHVWFGVQDQPDNIVHDFSKFLDLEEHQRAERYVFNRDKHRFIMRRGYLRTIIGKYYLDVEPNQIRFNYGVHGKPYLANGFGEDAMQFTLSDSHAIAIYAFTKHFDVGIDIEQVRFIGDEQQIVDSSCSEFERKSFNALPEADRQEAFFNCWTRKEAFIKAIGKGLYYPLDQFDVSICPGKPAKLLNVSGQPNEAVKWSMIEFSPETGYKAALVVKTDKSQYKYWRLPETCAASKNTIH